MVKIIKIVSLVALLICGMNCIANSIKLTVNNTNSHAANSSAPVYVYPDFDESVFANILNNGACKYPTHSCIAPASNVINFIINEYNGGTTTIICLSKHAPTGSFDHCAPSACEVAVNFGSGPKAKPLNSNCAGYTFPSTSTANSPTDNNVIQVNQ